MESGLLGISGVSLRYLWSLLSFWLTLSHI